MNAHRIARAVLTAAIAAAALSQGAFAASTAKTVAIRIGVTPEALALAGFSAADAEAMLSRLKLVQPVREQYDFASARLDAAMTKASAEAELLARGKSDAATVDRHRIAAAAVADAQSSVDAALDALFLIAVSDAPTGKVQRLVDLRESATRRLPTELRALPSPRDDWPLFERAARQEIRCARTGEQLRDDYAALLDAARAEPDVSDAQLNLWTNLDDVRAVFKLYN